MVASENTWLYLMVGISVIIGIIAYQTINGKGSLPDLRTNQVTFRTPLSSIITLMVILLSPAALGLYVLPHQIADVVAEHDSLSITLGWAAAFTAFFVAAPALPALVLFGLLPGPQKLRFDKSQRTYELRFGTYYKRRFRTGPWAEITGICVKKLSAKGSITYGVYVAWQSGLSEGPSLALVGSEDQAKRLAWKIAQALDLQVVIPAG